MSLPRIAVDAMGGDEGVRVMVEGAALARRRHDRFKFLLVGDEERIKQARKPPQSARGDGNPARARCRLGR
jgi:glycerol-3-phosphate acyltransferase PlsX